MAGHRELVLDDYLAMLRRRVWWIVIPTMLAPLIGYGISLTLPNRYTSQTLVLVEQQKIPEGYVKSVVTEELNERLATMQEQILSRTRLQPIIERFKLFQDDNNLPMEERVNRMRRSITVTAVKADFGSARPSAGLPGFYISFTAPSARQAQQVCGEITSMFMEENLRVREQRAENTTDFLQSQLEEAKRNLDGQDGRLATFKKKYVGQLPGQEQSNFNMLASLNTQLSAVTDAINRLHQEKTYTDSMLNAQLGSWQSRENANSPQTLEQQLAALQSQMITLKSKYTDTHPDVIKLTNDIASVKKKIDEGAVGTPVVRHGGAEPVEIHQLRAQLASVDAALKDKQREQDRIQAQIRNYEARLQLSPMVEEEYKQVTRDYQTALTFYNDLLTKKTQSQMATSLERRQQGEQFRVMDPPNLPEKPTFPNRPMFASGGLAVGLGLGLSIAFLLEMRDKSIRTERDVQFYLELPLLALMPSLDYEGKNNGVRPRFWQWRKKLRRDREPIST